MLFRLRLLGYRCQTGLIAVAFATTLLIAVGTMTYGYSVLADLNVSWFVSPFVAVYFVACVFMTAGGGFAFVFDRERTVENRQLVLIGFPFLVYPPAAHGLSELLAGHVPSWLVQSLFKSRVWLPLTIIGLYLVFLAFKGLDSMLYRHYMARRDRPVSQMR